ncbi:prepilin-type N-terminal cleavage/methylation domain-containing protein [Xenorhabdus hominickii]|uniref:Prepilin-type N-terminal cleavage/methylation domain-containing protein n=1 Tax=Xenorhabdus hominickii TaxID=351679 RepID=A0A2G0QGE3_XENHO|nr:prepilin-type N-terminal cleavage/methylation domain-containing protein [Xenorhabdus hominickii]AOM42297.1 prepilin-type N-terminal cleavage/methylation domain-containing protein [Xenorhabdus hominickii]PHM58303.1 hypothetical protein Xhom_01319 [Xenorhabdus hominickii]
MKIFHQVGRQEGMSLPEVMVASVVFAISVLGLMRYHQALSTSFQQYWVQLKVVRDVYNQLEQYEQLDGHPEFGKATGKMASPLGWKAEFQREFHFSGCYQLTVKLTLHYNKPSKLERWICASGGSDV